MTCGQCVGIERVFDEKEASRELKKYRKRGPGKTAKILIDVLISEGVQGRTLLDIGGGVGAIQHELLKAGASRSVGVDASPSYVAAAREESASQGLSDRAEQYEGDFVAISPSIQPADVVTLDRVICCYHDVDSLVTQSSALAREFYALAYPHDSWLFRNAARMVNLFLRLRRCPFRAFIHSSADVNSLVERNGFHLSFYRKTPLWQVVIYGKDSAASTSP